MFIVQLVQSDRQQFGSMASEIHFDRQQFDLWPLALGESVAATIHFDFHKSNLGGKCSYRFDRQQNDPAILGGQKFILIANHPIRGGEISSPAIRPLDHWPLAAKVHSCRQQFDLWRQKFFLIAPTNWANNSITGGPNSF